MASPASLATLGSTRPSGTSGLDVSPWPVSIRRIHVVSRISFNYYRETRRWCRSPAQLCKCMVTTGLIEEKKASVSPESTFKSSNGGSRDGDADLVLKPAPKPVLKAPDDSTNSTLWSPAKVAAKVRPEPPVEDKESVLESLGEVLEKAEKLETANSTRLVVDRDRRDNGKMSDSHKPPQPVSASSPLKKTKTLKSVWRKGDLVANKKRVVSYAPRAEKGKEDEKGPSLVVDRRDSVNLPVTPSMPEMSLPRKPTPKFQERPSVAPPSPPRPPVLNKPNAVRERKPILIDKFAPKKLAIDPIAAEAILAAPTKPGKGPPPSKAPTKPGKGPPPSKVKDERRKRSTAAGSLRRRLADDDEIPQVDASELGVSIPGVKDTRKGQKWTKASRKASRKAARLQAARAAEPVRVEILEVGEEGMLAEDLAYNLAVSEADILSYLYTKGVKPHTVQTLDKDMVKMICKEYDVEVLEVEPARVEDLAKKNEMLDEQDLDMLEDRPPVITIMGHVDHGKTTLLDYIRKSKVVASEAGGITQGIGAYKVQIPVDGKLQSCVFLDTPGHEAFGAMRARGAKVTDIAIIVVAADDGVRPQTNEAIAHAKAAGVPIIVAINKVDKDGASPDRVMQELSSVGLMPEMWGGDTPMVQISALKGENVDELLETIVLVAELQELKANPHRSAKGTVIEACLDTAKGPVATLIVQNGTLKKSDIVVCGEAYGKVRALFDDRGNRVDEAGPSTAVQVMGLSDVPIAGDGFEVVESLDVAREKAEACGEALRVARISAKAGEGKKVTLSSIASAVSAGKQDGLDMHQLNIILKVDVQGSIEAIRQAIQVLPQDNVTLKFLLQAPGNISTSDVDLAVSTEAVIFGFNVKAPGSVKSYADKKMVEIRLYRVIYDLIDDMRKAMEGLLYHVEEQISIGTADVRATFSSGSGRVAGCMVAEGKVVKDCGVRVLRRGKIIHTGTISSLRRVKEEVKEVVAGLECGIGMDDFNNFEAGDVIEAFNTIKKQRTLEEASASVKAALSGAGVQL